MNKNRIALGIFIVAGIMLFFSSGWIIGHGNPVIVHVSPNSTTLNAIRLGAVSNYTDNIGNSQTVDAVFGCPNNRTVALTIILVEPVAPNGTIAQLADYRYFSNIAYIAIANGTYGKNSTYQGCNLITDKPIVLKNMT